MIIVTGDTHRYLDMSKLNTRQFEEQKYMTKEDYLIICGDFGVVMEGMKKDKWFIDWYNNKNFTTLFIPGNHENYDLLDGYEEEEWCGGKVSKIGESVIHLKRGEVYNIPNINSLGRKENVKIFTFGGAYSIDREEGKEGVTWWERELPSKEEYKRGIENLKKNNNEVDLIITHTAPKQILPLVSQSFETKSELEIYLGKIHDTVKYKKWYFGHFHIDRLIDSKHRAIFNDLEEYRG